MSEEEKQAIAAGIDLSLIEVNLSLTPEKRLDQHDEALKLLLDLRSSGEELRRES